MNTKRDGVVVAPLGCSRAKCFLHSRPIDYEGGIKFAPLLSSRSRYHFLRRSAVRSFCFGLAAIAALVLAVPTRAEIISVQFGVGGTNGGAGMDPADVAGVVPVANWNVAVGDSGAMGPLVNSAGI